MAAVLAPGVVAVRDALLANSLGDVGSDETSRILRAIHVSLLAGKMMREGKVTMHLCENFACQVPIVGAESLESALGSG